MVRRFSALISFLLTATVATATNAAWSFRKWQTDDHLPNNTVTGLAQAPDGFLWIASPGPLARFDGIEFEQFVPSQIVAGYHQNARALLVTRDGSLWLSMAHGPVFRIRTDNTTEVFTNDLPDLVVQHMIADKNDAVWLIYPGGTLRRIRDGRVETFTEAQGWPKSFAVTSLACDGKGNIWYMKGHDLGAYTNGYFIPLAQLVLPTSVMLTGARDGGVWLATGSQLLRYNGGEEPRSIGFFQTERPGLGVSALYEDREGGVWIGTESTGLFYYHPQTGFQQVETSYPQILSILEDNEGNMWVGTGGGGLNRIRKSVVRLETATEGFSLEAMQSICQDANGGLWAVTQNNLLIHQTDSGWTAETNSPIGDACYCAAADDKGGIWAGGRSALGYLKDDQWKVWRRFDGLLPGRVYGLFIARNGDLYVSGSGPESLQRMRDGVWHKFNLSADSNFIRAFAEDLSGNVWAGTSKGMVLRIHGDTITDETTNTFGSPTSVRSMCATSDGSIWFACAGGGLGWRNREGHFARITEEQGLVDNYLSQVIPDDKGWLWFGSDHGIFKVRTQSLKDVMEHRAARVQCIQYGRSEGLAGLQANFGRWPAVLRGSDGCLWMPMRTALAVVDPWNGGDSLAAPSVLLKRVDLDGRPIAAYGRILPTKAPVNLSGQHPPLRLPPKHYRLEFNWAAINFSAPENVNFRYQLEGFDDHWINAGTDRTAGYTRLPAGNYHFKLQARNGDGEWQGGEPLAVQVAPFVWQTWWFRSLAIFLFTAVVIAIVRYVSFRRLRSRLQILEQQAALERERSRIARDIHDDLGGSLTQMALLSGLAERDGANPAKVGEYVHRIAATTHHVIRTLDEVVWAVNPRNDNLRDMFQYIGQFALEFLSAAGIRLQLDLPEKLLPQPVSAEVRHNLFLVTKETLNNISRHAKASEVRIRARLVEGRFRLTIEDNGRGFERGAGDAFSNGVRNMHQRMEEIGGACEIESVVGKGTRVTLSFPLEQ